MGFKDNSGYSKNRSQGSVPQSGVPNGQQMSASQMSPNAMSQQQGMQMNGMQYQTQGGMQGQQMQNPQMYAQQMQGQQYNAQMQNPQMQNPQMQQYTQQAHQQANMQSQNGMYQNQMYQNQQSMQTSGMQTDAFGMNQTDFQDFDSNKKPKKKKKSKLLVFVFIVIILVVAVFVIKSINMKKNIKEEVTVSDTECFDKLQVALKNYDAYSIDEAVGALEGDSYLAQEWAYVNRVQLQEEYIKKICGLVNFTYPSGYNGIGAITVTVPDFTSMMTIFQNDKDYIVQLYKSAGYNYTDYIFEQELFNLYCQYVVDNVTVPTKEVQVDFKGLVAVADERGYVLADDSELDDYLFGTDDFHELCKWFTQTCIEWSGIGEETYTTREEVHNDEYDAWYKLFSAYYEADGGRFNKNTSMWEPWYLRDEETNELILDENGEKIVNYYSVKDENGKDWIQPDEWILVEVEKTRPVDIEWVEETGINYVMIGTNFLTNKYTGKHSTIFKVGDGSRDYPAGIGTPIVTKVLCDDGYYHDIKVSLKGYWTGQEAIDYAEGFSGKNKGFTTTSPVKLICFEFEIENLESVPITFTSEMTIADRNYNVGTRTGTLYGFFEEVTLEPHEKKTINDWASSTELDMKYLCWGKSFGREFPLVYFNVLAGTGEIPSYSAYEQFTGKPQITESSDK